MTTTPQPGDRAEQEVLDALQERDTAEDWADRLADAIATLTGVEIGEHSSANNPWMNALEAADTKPRWPARFPVSRVHPGHADGPRARHAPDARSRGRAGRGDRPDAVMPVLAEALAERDLALWLHAETTWRYDTSIRDCAHVLIAQRDGVAETLGMLHDTPMGDLCDAIRLLRWLHAEAEWKRERLSTLLRGMARRASHSRRLYTRRSNRCNIVMHERDLARAELARLREQAVVLPADARNHVERTIAKHTGWVTGETANMARDLLALIESWRPSTGDTEWTAKFDSLFPPDAASETFRVQFEDDEPEPAWGVDRPVHGHTEQTGDGNG